jgi:hypothetical protein
VAALLAEGATVDPMPGQANIRNSNMRVYRQKYYILHCAGTKFIFGSLVCCCSSAGRLDVNDSHAGDSVERIKVVVLRYHRQFAGRCDRRDPKVIDADSAAGLC